MKIKIQGTDHDRKRKVTSSMAGEMKAYRRAGLTLQEIADKFGVSKSTVNRNTNEAVKEAAKNNYKKGTHDRGKLSDANREGYKLRLFLAGLVKSDD